MQLNPQKNFTIIRQLDAASLDTNTYFVQSVVRLAANNNVVATVNLVNQGNQYFTGNFLPPADPGGNGYYISITTSVYTDAAHTQLSPVYSTTNEVYLVQLLFSPSIGYGGSGDSFDPKLIRAIIQEELRELKEMKRLSSEEVEDMLTNALLPHQAGIDSISMGFSRFEDFDARNKQFISEFSNRKEEDKNAILQNFKTILEQFASNLSQDNVAHRALVEKNLDAISKSIMSTFESFSSRQSSYSKNHTEEVKKVLTSHFNDLISQENGSRKTKIKSIIEESLHKALSDGGITPSLITSVGEEKKPDFNGMARKFISGLTS